MTSEPTREELASLETMVSENGAPGLETEPGNDGFGPTRLTTGQQVDRYVVVGELGKGGMGVVYSAYDPDLDRKVALKLLRTADSQDARTRLMREAQAMARLSHPNVVTVHDVGEHEGAIYVAMEFVDGETLGDWLDAAPRSRLEILDAFLQAAQGLMAAHAKGLIHRDFKPDNVMVERTGRVRVMDFGLARPDGERIEAPASEEAAEALSVNNSALDVKLTRVGAVVGTPAYMAPEQFEGGATDARTDQFSFCVALWEALHGERPFPGDSHGTLFFNVLRGKRRPPKNRAVPRWLQQVMERGLETRPDGRFSDLGQLVTAIEQGSRRKARFALGVGAFAVVALLGGLVGAQRWDERRRVNECQALADEIDGLWNEDQRRRLVAGFVEAGVPDPERLTRSMEPWLEGWVQGWRETRRATCERHAVQGAWDDELRARADDCLEERRQALEDLVDVFADNRDREAAFSAPVTAADLPNPRTCGEELELRLRPEASTDPAGASEVRRILSRADARMSANDGDGALKLVEQAHARATELEDASLQARTQLGLGAVQRFRGEAEVAERELIAAYDLAGPAKNPDVQLASAVTLIGLTAKDLHQLEKAEVWVHAAENAMALTGDAPGPRRVQLINARAIVHLERGNLDEAETDMREALALTEELQGADHPHSASIVANLALLRSRKGEHDEALELAAKALATREKAFGKDHPGSLAVLSVMAGAHRAKGDLKKAREIIQRSLDIVVAAYGEDHAETANSLQDMAVLDFQLGEPDKALEGLDRAIGIMEKRLDPDHPTVAGSVFNRGYIALRAGDLVTTRRDYERALKIYLETYGEQHAEVARARNGLAELALAEKNWQEAEAQARKTLALMVALELPAAKIAARRWTLARALAGAGKLDEARREGEVARDQLKELNPKDPTAAKIEAWLGTLGEQ